ncbi:MAG: CDP-archaeol synthase [Oscillatoria sp. PMC 1051.18]|nr:CDP-archaeol synthase [Oscillatoria sp. PMC 1050.18]MEC5031963.1 CDP-archaeol synthase [Oscillatoria sp. PMC 1051.18]
MDIALISAIFLNDTLKIIWLGSALFLAGVWEALLWKSSWFQFCNYPINVQVFGENKKWRGLITLPLTHLVSVFVFQYLETELFHFPASLICFSSLNLVSYGLLVGLIFNLSELPNSFLKRRLNIPPGDESNPLFYLLDNLDSTYGTLLLWYLYFHFPLHLISTGLIVSPLLFFGATWIRRQLKLKS